MDYNSKIVMLKGADGAGITDIKKTSTNVLTDTYTITLSDGQKHNFDVTNGKGIKNIEKASTSGLVDTYKITYNDGTTQNYTLNNGKGISSISKTGTSGLVDTYTITYNDGTTSTFTVTNGKDGSITDEILFNNMNSLCVFQIYEAGVFRELGGNAPTTYGNVICFGKRRPWNGRSYGDGYFLYVSSNTELYVGTCVNDEATITWKELTNNPITNSDIDTILNS